MKPLAIALLALALTGCAATPAEVPTSFRHVATATFEAPVTEPTLAPEIAVPNPVTPIIEEPALLPPGALVPGDESDWNTSACASATGIVLEDGSFVCA